MKRKSPARWNVIISRMANIQKCSTRSHRNSRKKFHRSEERRVGKECRSRCDWSSDVCSSDLNEAQIACALECYHLAHGEYPEMLDALAPQFTEKISRDIIGGQPLHYRRTADGKFLLYSVGWNETDDSGNDGGSDFAKGDWVWKN